MRAIQPQAYSSPGDNMVWWYALTAAVPPSSPAPLQDPVIADGSRGVLQVLGMIGAALILIAIAGACMGAGYRRANR